VTEAAVTLWAAPRRRTPLDVGRLGARVEVVAAGLGADGALLEAALAAGAEGLVAVVLGAGHAPPAFLAVVSAAAERVPVVLCVRPERGCILHGTYGFAGAERDVRSSGAIPAPSLSPAAARIVLMAALGAGLDRAGIAAAFAGDDEA
jgi:L-asparaginase